MSAPRRLAPIPGGPEKIVSGGQTGADRAALDVALGLGLATGGWLPLGRLAEDGVVDHGYPGLIESDSADPAVRTRLNVRDSDATLVITHGAPIGGTALTIEAARARPRPVLHVDLAGRPMTAACASVRAWLDRVRPRVLNVAGPRASEDPAIGDATRALLARVLGGYDGPPDSGAAARAGRERTDAPLAFAALADAPETLPVLEAWFECEWAAHYGPRGTGEARRDLTARAGSARLPFAVVARSGARLCGTAALEPVAPLAPRHPGPWLAALLVAPAHRGRGIGSRLVREIEARAARLGFEAVHAVAGDASGRLLERNGWVRFERLDGRDHRGHDLAVHRKALPEDRRRARLGNPP